MDSVATKLDRGAERVREGLESMEDESARLTGLAEKIRNVADYPASIVNVREFLHSIADELDADPA